MPRKAKPTLDGACALHLRDLQREHGRPPADIRPAESERFACARLLSARATAPPRSPGSSQAGTSSGEGRGGGAFNSGNRPSRY
jgi:hypothetical protein